MDRFEDQDLTGSVFRECDLSGARLIGVVMQDVVIDGYVTNLNVNGVDVADYVEAELDRRHPVRMLIRSDDPDELREARRVVQTQWSATVDRLRDLPDGTEHTRVDGEWSAVETMRHLVFVHDSWFRRCVLGLTEPFTACGLAIDAVPGREEQGLDLGASPSLDEVVAIRLEQAAELASWLDTVSPETLQQPAPVPEDDRWPPYARGRSVAQCLRTVLNEEEEHHNFCVRDLDRLALDGTG